MSLETEVSLLTSSVETLVDTYQGKVDEIDGAVSSALATPEMIRNRYVDAVIGDDAADGLTPETAKKTMASAVASVPDGLIVYLFLLSDVALEYVDLLNRDLIMWGWDAVNGRTERKMSVVDDGSGNWPKFYSDKGARSLNLNSINFELPANTVFPSVVSSREFFRFYGATTMRIADCRLSSPNGGTNTAMFYVETMMFGVTTFIIDVSAQGYLLNNVAAGTDPDLRRGISTDMTSA